MAEKEECKGCRFWERWPGRVVKANNSSGPNPRGSCRKRAPVMVIEGAEAGVEGWPSTKENDWCGEYEPI